MMMHLNISQRLPRPDEVIKYERLFKNETRLQEEQKWRGCMSKSGVCPERLVF